MAQNLKPPCYQEYAANMLASRNFRLMNIAERGLLYTIRLECWLNKQVPSSSYDLAKYIGYDVSDVKAALTDRVKSFLYEKDGSLTCPDLEDYRKYLDDRREAINELIREQKELSKVLNLVREGLGKP